MIRFLAFLVLLTTLGSCYMGQATLDQDLDPQAIAQLQAGTSSASDVVRLLGAPNQVVELGDKSAWLYQSQNTKQMGLWLLVFGAYGEDSQTDRCWVFFDASGTLTHFGASLHADQAEYNLIGS
ncbi:MAG: outer membrane protein assembly factor BamE domain-containing protein [Planctomycetota bacterium]|jgi:outer membrane protein assembly factor BamE (lipoprotein component of BamABCDE complex)